MTLGSRLRAPDSYGLLLTMILASIVLTVITDSLLNVAMKPKGAL